ncbi:MULTISPECIES: TetR/AcrR family transcriptional regulator [unclassified Mycolicibacterium]|uniref:TetR/AcrR family transcriptional regulator n=1 Tax=unclassified Mycolicibacterium TaxID=2636767 RepID=UPI0012DE3A4E|nr:MULTISPECIES: TetR/AcrR family transcriptional regulator C-terminal domain-containing protein [unclassified Mycolicibacterium]MUL80428.1 TetR/AcrR family transcriptional regulator [Mycolicibacterium sp. CBMA 329]MUL86195.1 TetR/AcrR family transcriptional regulator [Mycolicibacterium sp. CBMA 331]MUM01142.1 TetR/AcrR family transcriptional regulator [Mycolicibacterium sp. CBMA 334]MUM30241.1 TetR/AcrR family transcriptional regulator [Mycolicibacterium sp. CBMA 295]MUM36491.1 TetR/AcrR fami
MPRPRSLSQTQVAAAALAVVDADGLAGLSMRAVARRLGMGTMSLYRYVADRDELESMVVDLVLDGIDPGLPRGSARHQLTELAERVRIAAARHPAVAPLMLTHRHRSPASLRWGESVLGVLTAAGYDGKQRVYAFRAVLAYIFGSLQIEMLGSLTGPGTQALASLPAGDYPLLSQTAALARDIQPDEEFRRGFEILLRALDL